MTNNLKTLFQAGLIGTVLLAQSASAQNFLNFGLLGATANTHMVSSKTTAGEPCMMTYEASNGLVQFWDVTHYGGEYGSSVSSSGLSLNNTQLGMTGLTNVVPFKIGTTQYFFIYDHTTGVSYFNRVNANCTSSSTVQTMTAAPNVRYTHFDVVYINGAPYILSYDAMWGAMRIEQVNSQGKGSSLVWKGIAGLGWTNLMAFSDSLSDPGFLLYNANSGAIQFNVIRPDKQGFDTTYSELWSKGSTHFAMSPSTREFLVYDAKTGRADFMTVNPDAKGFQSQSIMFLTKGFNIISPFSFYVKSDAGGYGEIGGFATYIAKDGSTQVWAF